MAARAALVALVALYGAACTVPDQAGSLLVFVVDDADQPLPLARVDVVGVDADLTGGQGESEFGPLRPGRYLVRASAAPRCRSEQVVVVRSREQTTLTLTLRSRLDLGPDRGQIGFDQTVTIRGADACEDEPVRWSVVSGDASLVELDGPRAVVHTRPLHEVITRDGRPGIVAVSRQAAQVVRLRAEVGDEGAADEVMVSAAPPSAGVFQVPTGADTYFDGGDAPAHRFSLVAAPRGSAAVLEAAASRFPWLRPDLFGTYRVRDDETGLELEVEAGRYEIVPRDCDRPECHPVESEGFVDTRHARTFWRGLSGELGPTFSLECTPCHAVGSDPLADTGGFDDVARAFGWTFSPPLEPTAVPPRVADLANVWCTSCHGPGRIVPTDDSWERGAKYSVEVCALCHDGGPDAPTRVAEWRRSRMARFPAGLEAGAPARERGCARCHSAQGFVAWQRRGEMATVADARIVQPITCAACHDPHSSDHPFQLRVWEGALGSTALCITCHDALASRTDPTDRAERRAPHASQGVLVLRPGAPHGRGTDACVACHMEGDDPGVGRHSFLLRDAEGRASQTACTGCHPGATNLDAFLAAGDWDGDGVREPHVEEVEALLALLQERLRAEVALLPPGCSGASAASVAAVRDRIVLVDAEGGDLGDCDGDGAIGEGEQPALVQDDDLYDAAFVWLETVQDGSRGLHDPRGQVIDLQDAIRSLGGGAAPPWDRPPF